MKKYLSTPILFSILMSAPLSAAINIAYDFHSLRDSSGVAVANGTFYALVGSNASGELPSATDLLGGVLSLGEEFSNGSSIFEIGTTSTSGDFGTNGNAAGTANNLGGTNFAGGSNTFLGDAPAASQWGIYWFTGVSEGATLVGGENYGFFQSSTIDLAGDTPMVLPSDGGDASTGYFDEDTLAIASISPTPNTPSVSDFSANFTVVPEPSAAILGLLGAFGLFFRRGR